MIMSRMGYWCKACACFRENIEDALTRHVLAVRDILCTEEEDPFANGLCAGFMTFAEAKKKQQTKRYRKAS
jgi:hypothetical protein